MEKLEKKWRYKDLRNKIIVAVSLLVVTRILAHIPLPGVDLPKLQSFFQQNQAFGLLNMFSGGTMSNFSVALMGVGPYITASIVFQLLTMIIPSLEEMQKEGEQGRQKINQYTRYATVPLALIQAFSMLVLLRNQGIIDAWTPFTLAVMLSSVTCGTVMLMWLGELITERGIGNGISLIITVGILSEIPTQIRNTVALLQAGDTSKIIGVIAFALAFIVSIAVITYVQESQRNIPVSYARKLRQGGYGSSSSFLPIRLNVAGVIPIIFASSLLVLPTVLANYLQNAYTPWIANAAKVTIDLFNNQIFYGAVYLFLIVFFTYFYTGIVFKPDQIAENLQKQGGFVPGIRPGNETSRYLSYVISRITLFGSIFLGLVALLPFIIRYITHINTLALTGTGILIIVSVVVETSRQIESQVKMHTYEAY